MSYLKTTTIVQTSEDPDYAGASSVMSLEPNDHGEVILRIQEFELTASDKMYPFDDAVEDSCVRSCIIQNIDPDGHACVMSADGLAFVCLVVYGGSTAEFGIPADASVQQGLWLQGNGTTCRVRVITTKFRFAYGSA